MSKERLEEIKKHLGNTMIFLNRKNGKTQLMNDLNWLIQQAEEKLQLEERVKELEKEKEELKESLSLMAYTTDEIIRHSEAKDEVIRSYSQTLEFYADKKNYETDVVNQWEPIIPVMKDIGEKATQALQGGNDNE